MSALSQHIRDGWVEFLLRHRWSHSLHLTAQSPSSKASLEKQFRRLFWGCERVAKRHLGAFLALERGAAGNLHCHALLAGADELTVRAVQEAWKGHSRVHRVHCPEAVVRYATKWAPVNSEDYLLVGRLDRYRRSSDEEN